MTGRGGWRERDFGIFWLVQTLSVAGDSFSSLALPLLVLHMTGSVAQMGLLTALAGAAAVVTGIFAGVLVDRVDRRALLITCDLVRAGLYALVPLLWLIQPQIWLLYLVVPLGAALGMIFQVGYVAAVPSLVPADRITEANGRLSATYAVAGVVGPILAGLVSAAAGPTTAVAVDAATFGVSALGLALVRLRVTAPPIAPDGTTEQRGAARYRRDLLVGIRFLVRHPVLRTLTVLLALLTFLATGLTDIFTYHLKQDLGRSDGTVGYVLAVAAVGTVVAALVVAPARRRLGFGACWIGANVTGGIAVAAVGVATDVPVVAALVATYTFAAGAAGICSMSLRQQVTPDHLLGRVTSAFWTVHSALGPLGAATLTAATARYGSAATCLVAGVASVLIAMVGVLTPIRQARPELSPVTA